MLHRRIFFLIVFSIAAVCSARPVLGNPQNASGQSSATVVHVRVVSLSFVVGTVIAREPGSSGWVRASLNMPIQEGMSIATGRRSFAEVQFEDGSTVRLSELSRLDFTQMALGPDNRSINHLALVVGVTTVSIIPERHDEYTISVYGANVLPHGKSDFRTDFRHGQFRVEVFKGRVGIAGSNQSDELKKHQVLACDYRSGQPFRVTNRIQLDEWDKWVEARSHQLRLAANRDEASTFDPWGGWVLFPPVLGDNGF